MLKFMLKFSLRFILKLILKSILKLSLSTSSRFIFELSLSMSRSAALLDWWPGPVVCRRVLVVLRLSRAFWLWLGALAMICGSFLAPLWRVCGESVAIPWQLW